MEEELELMASALKKHIVAKCAELERKYQTVVKTLEGSSDVYDMSEVVEQREEGKEEEEDMESQDEKDDELMRKMKKEQSSSDEDPIRRVLKWLDGCWFYRPEETFHLSSRKFYEKVWNFLPGPQPKLVLRGSQLTLNRVPSVFATKMNAGGEKEVDAEERVEEEVSMNDSLQMSFYYNFHSVPVSVTNPDHQCTYYEQFCIDDNTFKTVRPTEVPEEDVFVCECRYNEVDKDIRRLKGLRYLGSVEPSLAVQEQGHFSSSVPIKAHHWLSPEVIQQNSSNLANALWTLRDHMMRDSLKLAQVIDEF
ncbi:hypothetical protein EMCRGX_G002996 [Ephydatia muelleri]